MSQNFSTMSDIYIPELMELDSYWQKAVEDAIYDTLKGEKRLHYALRNRKKINQKLEELGLRRVLSRQSFNKQEPEEEQESGSEGSAEEESREMVDSIQSRSRTLSDGDSPFKCNQKSSERPLLGNGSLEKLKKSQNSFNCEPMGTDIFEEDASGSDKYEGLDFSISSKTGKEGKNKKIRWLHMRNEGNFDNSDLDSANREESNNNEIQKAKTLKDKSYFLRGSTFRFRGTSKERKRHSKTEAFFDDDPYMTPSVRDASNADRKLHVALAKRDILNKKLKTSSMGVSSTTLQVNRAGMKYVKRKRKGKRHLSPFVSFYLEVYRELCQTLPAKKITEEAAKRWRAMTAKEKAQYNNLYRK